MSKNLTRKGLAFGAIVALGSTVIAGTPAFAAGELIVAPGAGTSYTTLVTETFNLKTTFAPGYTPSSYAQLKYQVVTDGTDVNLTTGVASQTVANVDAATAFTGDADNTTVVASTGAGATTVNYLGINLDGAASTATSTSVAVTAFVDANNDGALTAGEWNASQTVVFKNFADSGATLALTAPQEGDTTATGTVSFTSGVNTAQLTSTLLLKFDDNAATPAALAPSGAGLAGTLAAAGLATTADANGVLKATTGTLTAFTSSTVVGFRATLGGVALGTAQSATAKARTISTLVGSATAGANVKNTGALTATNRLNTAFTVNALASDASSKAVSGVAVTATVTTSVAASLSATKTLTVGSTTYNTANPTIADVALTTGSDGKVSLNLSTVGYAAGDTITVTFKGQNISSALVITQAATAYTYTELTTLDAKVTGNAAGAATGEGLAIAEGGTQAIKVALFDQFGVAPENGSYRVKAVATGRTATTTYFPVVGGIANVSITDAKVSGQTEIAVVLTSEKYDSAASTWGNSAAGSTVYIKPQALATPTVTLTASGTAPADYAATSTTSALVAADTRIGGVATLGSGTDIAVVSGTTTLVDSVVTITGPSNVVFEIDGSSAAGTLSAYASHTGTFKFNAYSNKTGTFTVTVTSNGVSKTADLVFTNVETAGTKVEFVATKSIIASGKTLIVTAQVTDKFGNAIDTADDAGDAIAVTYDGPGLPIGSLPVETDAAGKLSFRYLLASNESGAATVTVSYYGLDGAKDAAGDTTPDDIVVTKTILIGVSASVSAGSKKANVVVKNAEGLTVKVVSGTKSTTKIATSDSYKVSLSKLTSGSKTVKVYVEGILVASKKVTVRR